MQFDSGTKSQQNTDTYNRRCKVLQSKQQISVSIRNKDITYIPFDIKRWRQGNFGPRFIRKSFSISF